MFKIHHWYLWEVNQDGQFGVVRPSALYFATLEDGETVKAQYKALYPKSTFTLRLAQSKFKLAS